jgi:hypothetical protein
LFKQEFSCKLHVKFCYSTKVFTMKKEWFLVVFLFCLVPSVVKSQMDLSFADIHTRFKSVYYSYNHDYADVKYCNIKAFSRTLATFNVLAYINKTVDRPIMVSGNWKRELRIWLPKTIKINATFSYKYGTIYRPVVKGNFEWCAIMDGKDKNPLAGMFIDLLTPSVPQLFHPCPYEVKTNVKHVQQRTFWLSLRVNFDSTMWHWVQTCGDRWFHQELTGLN